MPHLSNCLEFARKLARGGFALPESVESRLIRMARDKERALNKRKASDRNEIAAAQSVVQSFLDVTREDIAKVIEDLRGQQEVEVMPTKITEDTKQKAETPTQAVARVAEEVQSVAKTEGQRDAAEVKKELIERLEKAIEDAPVADAGNGSKVTIEIPGDGTFTVVNTKENLRELLTKAKKLPTKFGPDKPGTTVGATLNDAMFSVRRNLGALRGFVINAINGDEFSKRVVEKARSSHGAEIKAIEAEVRSDLNGEPPTEPTPEKPAASEGALKSPPSSDLNNPIDEPAKFGASLHHVDRLRGPLIENAARIDPARKAEAREAFTQGMVEARTQAKALGAGVGELGAGDKRRFAASASQDGSLTFRFLHGAEDSLWDEAGGHLDLFKTKLNTAIAEELAHLATLNVWKGDWEAEGKPFGDFLYFTERRAAVLLVDVARSIRRLQGGQQLQALEALWSAWKAYYQSDEKVTPENILKVITGPESIRQVASSPGEFVLELTRQLVQIRAMGVTTETVTLPLFQQLTNLGRRMLEVLRAAAKNLKESFGTVLNDLVKRTEEALAGAARNARGDTLKSAPSSSESDESEIVAALERLYAQSGGIPEPTEEELAALAEFYTIAGKEMPSDESPNATPAEAPPPPQTSLKNAVVDEERAARGEPALVRPIVQSWGEAGAAAQRLLEADPLAGRRLLDGLKEHPRALKDEENALLLLYKVNVRHDLRKASHIVNTTQPFTEENRDAKARYDQLLNEQNDIDVYGKKAGTESGRSLAARKMMRDEDMSAESLMQRYRTEVNLGEALTEEQKQVVTKYAEKIQKAQAELDRINEELLKKRAEEGLQALAADVAKKARSKQTPVRKFLDEKARDARARLAGAFGPKLSTPSLKSAPSGLTAENLADLATVGAAYIEEGAADLPAFTKALTKEFGDKAAVHAAEIYDAAKQTHAKALADLAAASEPSGIVKTARERLRDNPTGDLDQRLLVDLATAYIRRGVSTAEEMVTRITQDIQPLYPDATESNVRTVLSGYGKLSLPTKDAVLRKLSEYKAQLRLIAALEDAQKGQPPLKSGFQRGPQSQRVRQLGAELRDAMRRAGIETTEEEQLASARKAIVSRLTHQIEDLNGIIAGKVRPRDAQAVVYYDAEMTALLKQRNELKAYVDDLAGPSPELKWNQRAQAAAKTSEEYYRRRIAAADFAAKKAPQQVESEATKRLRADAAKAKKEFNRLREATGIPQAEQLAATKARIEQEIAKAQQRLITGEKPPASQKKATPAELVALKTTLTRLRQAIQLVERRGKTDTERAEMAAKGLKRTIEDLERRIKQRDTKPKDKQAPVETPELKELRQTRDFLREVYASIKEAANPRRLPEEIALHNFRKRIEKLRTEAEQRLHAKEYLEVPKPDPLWQSRKDAAAFKLAKEKEAWATELFNKKLEARPTLRKIADFGAEVLNVARAIKTSLDFSAVLRQGGFIALGNPGRAMKALIPMFKAFASAKSEFATMEEIKGRANYPLYLQSKLYLANMDENDLTKMEESYMSRWAKYIPFVAGSERAFVVFLNKLRADSFDAMMATLGRDGRVTRDEGLALASYINVATGRGIIGSSSKPQGNPALSTVFFAPRLAASRFNLLAGQPLYGGNARTRKLIIGEYAKFLTGLGIAIALGALAKRDDDKEPFLTFDPRSSDFLKMRFGNTRVDMLAGLQQATVLLARVITGERINAKGEARPTRDSMRPLDALRDQPLGPVKYGEPTTAGVLGNFVRSKLSPVVGAAVNIGTGKDFVGQPATVLSEAVSLPLPMSISDIKGAMEDQGVPRGTAIGIISMLGGSVQTYDIKPAEKPKHSVKTDLGKFEAKVKKLAPKGAEPSTNIKLPDWMRRLAPATGQKSATNVPLGNWRERFKSVALS